MGKKPKNKSGNERTLPVGLMENILEDLPSLSIEIQAFILQRLKQQAGEPSGRSSKQQKRLRRLAKTIRHKLDYAKEKNVGAATTITPSDAQALERISRPSVRKQITAWLAQAEIKEEQEDDEQEGSAS